MDKKKKTNKSAKDLNKQIVFSNDSINGLIINAANAIIKNHGFEGLEIDEVAKVAGVSEQTINENFENMNGLIRTVIQRANFTFPYEGGIDQLLDDNRYDNGKALAIKTIDDYVSHLLNNAVAREILYSELKNPTDLIIENGDYRRPYLEKLFSLMIEFGNGSELDPKLVMILLFGTMDSFILKNRLPELPDNGFDVENLLHQKQLRETLKLMIEACYSAAEENKTRLN